MLKIIRFLLYVLFMILFIISADALNKYGLHISRIAAYLAGLLSLLMYYIYDRSTSGRTRHKWLPFAALFLLFFVIMFMAGFEARLSGIEI